MDRLEEADGPHEAPEAAEPAGGTGASLLVDPARTDDPVLYELVWRARRLVIDAAAAEAAAPGAGGDVRAEGAPRRAAVLITLCADPAGAPALLLTERSAHLAAHPGQVAFPGGKIEPGESAGQAALREAHEEVAMPAGAVSILGSTVPYPTRTGFIVVPVLALLTRRVHLKANPGEVASVFIVPFGDVMTPSKHRHVEAMLDGTPRSYYEVMASGKRIWGVTAAIMRLVHEKLYAP